MRTLSGILAFGTFLAAGCSTQQPPPEERTVQGVLEHFPSDVKSSQAWHGHNFMVGKTPVLPTDTVPEDVLKKHVGNLVVVTGIWHPGERWQPTEEEMNMPTPVDPEKEVVIRGDGLEASSVKLVDR